MIAFERIDAARLRARGTALPITLYATETVSIDRRSIESASVFDGIAATAEALARRGSLPPGARLDGVVLTPDFHRGSGVPVGTVIDARGLVLPGVVGGDVGCGMSLAVLGGVAPREVRAAGEALRSALRHAYFEGGRSIVGCARERAEVLAAGIAGLSPRLMLGCWPGLDPETLREAAARTHDARGGERVPHPSVLSEWVRPGGRDGDTRDGELGSIGGGNHFVELQEVAEVRDPWVAHGWGVRRGDLAVMVHSGSLGLGRAVAALHADRALAGYPGDMRRPAHGFLPLPVTGGDGCEGTAYLDAMACAARFAAANRLALSLMARQAVERALGRPVSWRLVRDLPHNLAWVDGDRVVHRKGACPAADGEALVVPGSMGTESALLVGRGLAGSLSSAPHGAGRALSRNAARSAPAAADGPGPVTPVDPARSRPDVRRELERRLAEEAPRAYRDLGPALETMEEAGIASEVARLRPLVTVKA